MGRPAQLMDDSGWTVPGLLAARHARTPEAIALWQLSAEGNWQASRWADYQRTVAALASGLRRRGLVAGERVGILAATSPQWDYAQLAILAAGGVAVGLDLHGPDEHAQDIARRCRFAAIIVDSPALLDKLGDEIRRTLRFVVSISPADPSDDKAIELAELLAQPADDDWNQACADAPATIIFTSGTTGAPKGIEYSHRQMCLAADAILSAFTDLAEGSRLACWLPLSNLFQRMINLCAIGRGAQTFYVADPREIMRHVARIEPQVFIGVPRFFEKLYAGIVETLAQKPAWQQALARWAWSVGDRVASAQRAGLPCGALLRMQHRLAEALVLAKLRGILGSQLRFMISGSAPMPRWLLERFDALGLPILEAYGISENIIPVALNRPGQVRFGTVGRPLAGCEVKLADDGELLVRGPGVFSGYFGESPGKGCAGAEGGEDGAQARVDADGYLASGDFATIDGDGYITLVGRKSEIFKTSTGRRVAPAHIENLLRQLPNTEYAAVFGAGRTQPTALLVVSQAAWQGDRRRFVKRLREDAAQALEPLPAYLRPAAVAITTQTFTIAGGELTANLKLRRRVIARNFAPLLDELHARIDGAAGQSFAVPSADGLTFYLSL